MHETDDAKILKKYDSALELLVAEEAYTEERLADKRSSTAKTRFLTLSLDRIKKDIVSLNERREEVARRIAWETKIANNLSHQ